MFTIKFFKFFWIFETFLFKKRWGKQQQDFYGTWKAKPESPLDGKTYKIALKALKQNYLEEFALPDSKT